MYGGKRHDDSRIGTPKPRFLLMAPSCLTCGGCQPQVENTTNSGPRWPSGDQNDTMHSVEHCIDRVIDLRATGMLGWRLWCHFTTAQWDQNVSYWNQWTWGQTDTSLEMWGWGVDTIPNIQQEAGVGEVYRDHTGPLSLCSPPGWLPRREAGNSALV